VGLLEFYDLTPAETLAVIDAAHWRAELAQRQQISLAWHTAALSRTKRMPPLAKLLHSSEPRKLEGDELDRRREEHAELTSRLDLEKLHGR